MRVTHKQRLRLSDGTDMDVVTTRVRATNVRRERTRSKAMVEAGHMAAIVAPWVHGTATWRASMDNKDAQRAWHNGARGTRRCGSDCTGMRRARTRAHDKGMQVAASTAAAHRSTASSNHAAHRVGYTFGQGRQRHVVHNEEEKEGYGELTTDDEVS